MAVATAMAIACGTSSDLPDAGIQTDGPSDVGPPDQKVPLRPVDTGPAPVGWRRLTEVDPGCDLFAIEDLSQLPPLKWTPCSSGKAGCEEALGEKTSWGDPFVQARASRDGKSFAVLRRAQEKNVGNWELYDRSGKPLGAWRFGPDRGLIGPIPASEKVYLIAYRLQCSKPDGYSMVVGTPQELRRSTLDFKDMSEPPAHSETRSDLVFFSDFRAAVAVNGRILQFTPALDSLIYTNLGPQFYSTTVIGNDIFAWNILGPTASWDGWAREYFIRTDGTAELFIGRPGIYVSSFATDGRTMWWIESSGAAAFTPQPFHALYKAPYTTRAADIRPIKVDDIRQPFSPEAVLAYDGVFVLPVTTRGDVHAEVYRASDGKHVRADFGPGLKLSYTIYGSETEFWGLAEVPNEPFGNSIARVQIGPWP